MTVRLRKISFEGLLQENVLGTFTVIRGFADLRDLAAVSIPMSYQVSKSGQVSGYQRKCDVQHVENIKRFLSRGRYRFFPELVLSLRSSGASDSIVSYKKKRVTHTDNTYKITVNLKGLTEDSFSRIRRIDGNHRLEAATLLAEETKRSATFKNYATAPVCFVILNSTPEDDELAEAMLFNLINSKALSITSEHSLSVLMRDEGSPSERFAEDPQAYLTRWISDKVKGWPRGFYTSMGDTPLTRLHSAAGVLLRPGGLTTSSASDMEADAEKIFGPLYELAIQLREKYEIFVNSYAFLPIAAEVYARNSKIDPAQGANTEKERIRRAARWLQDFARWFERIGGEDLPLPADPSVLWTVFKRDFDKRAGQVFIAMSFRESKELDGVHIAIKEAINQFNESNPNTPLSPMRIDMQQGASYEIPNRVFNEIDQSRLLIADLTDEKPNVYCEIGYAKAKGIPFFLTFRNKATSAAEKIAGVALNKVHLDLAPYRYIEYETTHELRDKLKVELAAWHEQV